MTISLTSFADGKLCYGYSWIVANEDELARRIALVAMGQSRHVAKILSGANVTLPSPTAFAQTAATKLLSVPSGADPWHRDGWLLQTMSWMVASQTNQTALTRAPHMILAHKGFDGLQLELDATDTIVKAAVIFEDKATGNPRKTITGEVWPEFALLESGDRENVLVAEVVSLLGTKPDLDVDLAIKNVMWEQVRRYRVSITVDDAHATEAGRKLLFKGYDKVAVGDVERRRSEIFHLQDLRPWMASLAAKAISHLNAMSSIHV